MGRLRDPRFAPDCTIAFDGDRIPARAGESVAAALLAAGRVVVARSSKYHRPRGAFCLAGSCQQCLARVDGLPNQRTCRTPCREGLTVETQNTLGRAGHDLLGIVDLVYAHGLDHHHLMTWSRFANRAAVAVSRQLAGLGKLPDRTLPLLPGAAEQRVDALVIGAGPAGLGAAEVLAAEGRPTLLVDQEPRVGGRLRCRLGLPGDPGLAWAEGVASAVVSTGGEVATATTVAGLWTDGGLCALLESHGAEQRLRVVRPRQLILATGTHAQPAAFEGSDLPGILAARGLLVALAEFGTIPGSRAAVLGAGAEADAVALRLSEAGVEVVAVREQPARALGRARVSALETGAESRVACDTIAVATPRAPAADLPRLLGAPFALDGATGLLRVSAGADGGIAPGVRLAGEVLGEMDAASAAESGRRAAAQALAEVRGG